jgi:hypothetical protein
VNHPLSKEGIEQAWAFNTELRQAMQPGEAAGHDGEPGVSILESVHFD